MKICPIMSYQKQYVYEMECKPDCAWADANGECIIKRLVKELEGKL